MRNHDPGGGDMHSGTGVASWATVTFSSWFTFNTARKGPSNIHIRPFA